jgi:hypothetical protein
VKDTRVCRGVECGTDHFLFVSSVELGSKWIKHKKERVVQKRTKVEKLQDVEVRRMYTSKMNERLSNVKLMMEWEKKVLCENDVEWGYKVVKESCVEIAREVCGEVVIGRKAGNVWWNDVVREAVEEKKRPYLKMMAANNESEKKELYVVYREKRQNAKEVVTESKMNARREFEEKMQSEFVSNKKLYWKMVN